MKLGEAKIDGKTYSFGYWDVDTSTEYLAKLIKLLGEPIARVMLGVVEKKEAGQSILDVDTKNLNTEAVASAFQGLALRLNEEEVKDLVRQCTRGILCDGKKIDYQSHFLGKIGHMMRVCLANLKHQYADFLAASPGGES